MRHPNLVGALFPIGDQFSCGNCGRNINKCVPLEGVDISQLMVEGGLEQMVICACGNTYMVQVFAKRKLSVDGPIDQDIIDEQGRNYGDDRRN